MGRDASKCWASLRQPNLHGLAQDEPAANKALQVAEYQLNKLEL
jgi:hypothetical protein